MDLWDIILITLARRVLVDAPAEVYLHDILCIEEDIRAISITPLL